MTTASTTQRTTTAIQCNWTSPAGLREPQQNATDFGRQFGQRLTAAAGNAKPQVAAAAAVAQRINVFVWTQFMHCSFFSIVFLGARKLVFSHIVHSTAATATAARVEI
jgi:hypothetical protein